MPNSPPLGFSVPSKSSLNTLYFPWDPHQAVSSLRRGTRNTYLPCSLPGTIHTCLTHSLDLEQVLSACPVWRGVGIKQNKRSGFGHFGAPTGDQQETEQGEEEVELYPHTHTGSLWDSLNPLTKSYTSYQEILCAGSRSFPALKTLKR